MNTNQILSKIIKEKADAFSYKDKKVRTRSGMTSFQEWLRKHGIKEHMDNEPHDKEKYVAADHPAAWALHHYYDGKMCLLVPKELAMKILVLGHLP